jgi:hypothetical protein
VELSRNWIRHELSINTWKFEWKYKSRNELIYMINVLTTNEDTFLLLSSPKIKVHFVSNINVFDRYFVYETLSKLSFDDLLFIWILYCLYLYKLLLPITSMISSNYSKTMFVRKVWRYQRDIIICNSKEDRQHNGKKKRNKRTNNDLQNIHIKLKIE